MRESSTRFVEGLLNSAADAAPDVRDKIVTSLTNMSRKDPLGVLQRCEQWLSSRKPSTTSDLHRFVVLKTIISILKETVSLVQIPPALRDALIALSVNEMTATTDLTSEWAHEGCRLCVELMSMFPKEGCLFLIEPMNSQQLPHFFVIEALAKFAEAKPLRFVPFLKEAVAKLLPIMSLAKQDNHRMLISKAMGNFADSILQASFHDGALTPRSAGSTKLTRADFFDVMYSGIQFLTGEWSRVSELRVRVQVGFAMGSMFSVCSDENRISTIPKLLPLMLNALKKEKPKDQAPVARGFANMLMCCSDEISQALVPHLEGILGLLLQCIVATTHDKEFSTNPSLKKNLEYLLSACEQIATFNLDGLIVYVGKILDAKSNVKDPMMRSGCLQIFRHLLSRPTLEPRLRPFIDNIIATLKLSITDADWRVRRALASCVIAMGGSDIPFFAALGGSDLLTFIIKNASISEATVSDIGKKDPSAGHAVEEVRDMCRNTLTLFSSSQQGKLDASLWPFIFEHMNDFVASPNLINAFPTVCRCIGQLGHRICETENYYIDFDISVNVPKPAALTAKFLTQCLVFHPVNTVAILEAMSSTAPLLDEPFKYQDASGDIPTPIGSLWLGAIPELEKVLAEGVVDADGWEDYVSKLVSKTMLARGTETWPEEVSQAAINDLPAYAGFPELFRACVLLIGIGVGKCGKKDFVEKAIEAIVEASNHDNVLHRVGLSKAFGYICSQHTDAGLEKLAVLARGPAEKRGLFSSSPKTGKRELVEASRTVAAGGLAQAARRMPQSVLPSRLDASIFPTLMSILVETKSSEVREGLLASVPILETPLRKLGEYNFRARDQFIESIIKTIPVDPASKAPSSSGLLKHVLLALKAITSLFTMSVQPPVPQAVQDKVTQFIIHFVQRPWTDISDDDEREATLVAVEAIRIMLRHNSKMPLDETVGPFLNLTVSPRDFERHRATLISAHIVSIAAEYTEELLAEGKPVACTATVGILLGRFVPRFLDSSNNVRIAAAEGLGSTMSLVSVLHREMVREAEVDIDSVHADIDAQRERVLKLVMDGTQSAEKEAASITKGLCGIIVGVLIDEKHFSPLLDTLLDSGLTDPQTDGANCSSVVMHGLIRGLGQKLPETSARRYFEILIESVSKAGSREQVLNGILVSIRNLVKHHTFLCFNAILRYPTPHADNVVKAFHAIASDSNLSSALLQHCLDTVLNSQLHEDVSDAKTKQSVRTLSSIPLAAACGAGWIAQTAKGAEAATSMRGAVFSTLALYLTAAHDLAAGAKVGLVANSLRYFLECTSEEITVDRIERVGWSTLADQNLFLPTITEITKFLCREELGDTNEMDRKAARKGHGFELAASEPTSLAIEIAQFILPYMNKPIRSHRRCTIACSSALLRHCIGEPRLLLSVVTGLQGRCGSDEVVTLRAEALAAFKGLTTHPYADIIAHMSPVLGAQLANFSDSCLQVAEAAIDSCFHILSTVPDKSQIAPNVINIILKSKALFESPTPSLRTGAYNIFGYVVAMTNEGHMDLITMSEQIHLHHATVLLHMEDDVEEVRNTAKAAYQHIGQFISNEISDKTGRAEFLAMYAKPHLLPGNKLNIEEFFNELCNLWVRYCSGRVNDMMVSIVQFLGRERDCLRLPAVAACGYFLTHLGPEDMTRANVDQVCNALVAHLNPAREKNARIRARAAESLGQICSV